MTDKKSRQTESRSQLAALAGHTDTPTPRTRSKAQTPKREQKVRTQPVRMSLDLMPADHREIRSVCTKVAEASGRASIPASNLVRACVLMILNDSDLRKQLADELSSGTGKL